MKIKKYFFYGIVMTTLLHSYASHAIKPSMFKFTYYNASANTIILRNAGNVSDGRFVDYNAPVTIKPKEMHDFFVIQNIQNSYHTFDKIFIGVRWNLTVKDKKGKILCQNVILALIQGKVTAIPFKRVCTGHWHYKIIPVQAYTAPNICPFDTMGMMDLPKSYPKNGKKCYPFDISIDKHNEIHVNH